MVTEGTQSKVPKQISERHEDTEEKEPSLEDVHDMQPSRFENSKWKLNIIAQTKLLPGLIDKVPQEIRTKTRDV